MSAPTRPFTADPLLGVARYAPQAIPFVVLLALVTFDMLGDGALYSLESVDRLARVALPLVLVAIGQMIVVATGGIDLSVGGIVSLSTAIAATQGALFGGNHLALAVLILLAGALFGLVNGILVGLMNMEPFVATLGTWSIASGIAFVLLPVDGGSVPQEWVDAAQWAVGDLGFSTVAVVAACLAWGWFRRLRMGIGLVSVGSSESSAYSSGIPVGRHFALAYVLSGFCSALAGLALVTLTASGSPTIGTPFILASIAAVVIGGNRLAGGRPFVLGTVAAVFILTVLGDVIFNLGLSSPWSMLISGLLLIGFVVVSVPLERWRGSRGYR